MKAAGKKGILMIALIALISITLSGQSEAPDDSFTNPLFNGADPWFIRKDGYYYYCFSAGNGISISKSPFITKRGEAKKVWQAPSEGWNSCCVWAPELHFIDGHWYIYYAAGLSGPPYIHQKTGVLRSLTDDPFSSYTDMGIVYTGDDRDLKNNNIWAIDMTVFEWRSRLYAVWSGWEKAAETDKTSQHLYIAEMSDPWTVKGLRTKLASPEEEWESGRELDLLEGPEILIKGNKLMIIYSCRESWLTDYRMGMLMLSNPDFDILKPGSWEKRGPVFEGPFGTGHCSFVSSPDGTEDWIIYHSKRSVEPGWQREVRAQPFGWDPEGLPDFGEPLASGLRIKRPSGEVETEMKLIKNIRKE